MPLHLFDWLWSLPHDDHTHTHVLPAHSAHWMTGGPQHGLDGLDMLSTRVSAKASFLESPHAGLSEPSVHGSWHSQTLNAHGTSFLFEKTSMVDIIKATPAAALVPLHAASIVISLPGHILFELGEGYLFGFQKGLELAFVGKALGAIAAFGVGRSVGCCQDIRESLRDRMQSWPVAQKAARSVEKGGHASVFLVRIAPLPCMVKNYALALLTDIPWSTFVPGTVLGLLPTTAAHVYAGTLAPTSTELVSGSGAAMKVVAAASTVGAVTFLGLLAAYCMHRQLAEQEEEEEQEAEKELPQVRPAERVETVKLFRPKELRC
mmetsp:Transcript_50741/g.121238  ORF Transcript_50741/g.121238 Transcript_50741/m.121238 type:complete len:320 (-) Transcript_50741:55-1014(-)